MSLNCDFENGFTGYFNDYTADFQWSLSRVPTLKVTQTDPSGDHTSGTGIYAFIDSGYPNSAGEKARLHSSLQDPIDSGCFSFYYNIFGHDIDTMNV